MGTQTQCQGSEWEGFGTIMYVFENPIFGLKLDLFEGHVLVESLCLKKRIIFVKWKKVVFC